MIDDFFDSFDDNIDGNIDDSYNENLEELDTSDIDDDNEMDDYSDLIGDVSDDLDVEETQADELNYPLEQDGLDEKENIDMSNHIYRRYRAGGPSFGLGTHCMVHGCSCRNFEGHGTVCTNCNHGYDKHF